MTQINMTFCKALSVLAVTLISFFSVAEAQDDIFEYDNIKYKILSQEDGVVEVCGYNEDHNLTSVTIPAVVTFRDEDFIVTGIGPHAFSKCLTLQSISLPNSITSLGHCCFEYCGSLSSVDLPNSLLYIGEAVFWDCLSLESIIIPDSVVDFGGSTFSGCEHLVSVKLPGSMETIPPYMFDICLALSSIEIPNTVKHIGIGAFNECQSLKSITLSESLESIEIWAFRRCMSLTSLFIPASVSSIKKGAFVGSQSLVSLSVDDNNPYYSSSNGILYNKDKTTLVAYPSARNDVEIDNGVKKIMAAACEESRALRSLTLPESIEEVGEIAFYECVNLGQVISLSHNPPTISWSTFEKDAHNDKDISVKLDCKIYVPDESLDLYKNSEVWKWYSIYPLSTLSGVSSPMEDEDPLFHSVFSLDGKRLSPRSLEELPRGFYIINGQKVLIGK